MNDPFRPPPPGFPKRNPFVDLYEVLVVSHQCSTADSVVPFGIVHDRARGDFIEICKNGHLGEIVETLYRKEKS